MLYKVGKITKGKTMKVSKRMEDYLLGACMLGMQIQRGETKAEVFVKWKNKVIEQIKGEE